MAMEPPIAKSSTVHKSSRSFRKRPKIEIEFIESYVGNGRPNIVVGGHVYTHSTLSKKKILWKCRRNKKLDCPGSLSTNLSTSEIVKINQPHNHEPNYYAVEALKLRRDIMVKASQTTERPGLLLSKMLEDVPDQTIQELPDIEHLKRSIRYRRVKAGISATYAVHTTKSDGLLRKIQRSPKKSKKRRSKKLKDVSSLSHELTNEDKKRKKAGRKSKKLENKRKKESLIEEPILVPKEEPVDFEESAEDEEPAEDEKPTEIEELTEVEEPAEDEKPIKIEPVDPEMSVENEESSEIEISSENKETVEFEMSSEYDESTEDEILAEDKKPAVDEKCAVDNTPKGDGEHNEVEEPAEDKRA